MAWTYRGVFKWPKNDHHIDPNIIQWNTCHIYPCLRPRNMCNTFQILLPPPTPFIIFDFQKNTYIRINQALYHPVSVRLTVWCHHCQQAQYLSIITVHSHWQVTQCPYTQSLTCHSVSVYTVADMSLNVRIHSRWHVTQCPYTQSVTCHSVSVYTVADMSLSIRIHSRWHVTQCPYSQSLTCQSVSVYTVADMSLSVRIHSRWHVTQSPYTKSLTCHSVSVCSTV